MIDAYLEGRMSEGEMRDFELQLKKDPIMENEFQLQKDIVSSLKEYRKAELKARFEGINVGSPWMGAGFNAVNITLSVVLTSLLGVGVFFYANRGDNAPAITAEETTPEAIHREKISPLTPISPDAPSKGDAGIADNFREIVPPATSQTRSVVTENAARQKEAERPLPVTGSNRTTDPAAGQPNIVEFENDGALASGEPIQLPENTLSGLGTTSPAPLEVEKKEDRKHHFHYQYYNSKLYLYGDFKNIPYELLELNNSAGKMLYMYYKDNFYYIQDSQMEIVPLKRITDPELTTELNELRTAR